MGDYYLSNMDELNMSVNGNLGMIIMILRNHVYDPNLDTFPAEPVLLAQQPSKELRMDSKKSTSTGWQGRFI
jgi:hypothetical protein